MANQPSETEKNLEALRADLPTLERRLEAARETEDEAARATTKDGSLDALYAAQRHVKALERLVEAHRAQIAELEREAAQELTASEIERIATLAEEVEREWRAFYEAFEGADTALVRGVRRMLAVQERIKELGSGAWPGGDRSAVEEALKARGIDVEMLRRHPVHRMQLRELSPASQFVADAFRYASGRSDWPREA